MKRQMIISDYNPAWPLQYEQEAARIQAAIGPYLAGLAHIGSTSIPNLCAKPIIDILGGFHQLADAVHCIGPLEALGYVYTPKYEIQMPFRRYFNKFYIEGDTLIHTHHLHMVEIGHPFWHDHLLFRDYLRAHPDEAAKYGDFKRGLIHQFADMNDYAQAKDEIILPIKARARAWQLGLK